MARRSVALSLAVIALAAAGIGAYSLLHEAPPPPETTPPEFTPSEQAPTKTVDFAELARADPVKMLEACLTRYTQNKIKGFRGTLDKHERVSGTLHDREVVRITIQDRPIAVLMQWEEGAQQSVAATLYAEGVTGNQIQTWRPKALIRDWSIDVKGSSARGASRYCIKDSGLYQGMLRTYTAWKERQASGEFRFRYEGTEPVERAGRDESGKVVVCHKITRTCLHPEVDSFSLDEKRPTDPKVIERDGFSEVTVFVDAERWLQVGTVLKKSNGELIGEYFFRDVKLATEGFPPDTFTVQSLQAPLKR